MAQLPSKSWGDIWTQLSVTNFLSLKPPQYESNHHKQDFSFLAPASNCKFIKFSPYTSPRLWIPHTPAPHFQNKFYIFLLACRRSKESPSIPGAMQKTWFAWLTSKTERWNPGSQYQNIVRRKDLVTIIRIEYCSNILSSNPYSFLPGNDLRPLDLSSDLLVTLMKYVHRDWPETYT